MSEAGSELVSRLTPNDVAEGLYELTRGLYAAAAPGREADPWQNLPVARQLWFLAFAKAATPALAACEGLPLREVALRLYLSPFKPEERLAAAGRWEANVGPQAEAEKLLFEAYARFLAILTDCDEVPSVADAARVIVDWFARKIRGPEAAPYRESETPCLS